jgi:hypothetical protein
MKSLWLPPDFVANRARLPWGMVGDGVVVVRVGVSVLVAVGVEVVREGVVAPGRPSSSDTVRVATLITSLFWSIISQPPRNTTRQAARAAIHTNFFMNHHPGKVIQIKWYLLFCFNT